MITTTRRASYGLYGLIGGAAIGVLVSVFVGPLPGGVFVLPTIAAAVGAAAAMWRVPIGQLPEWVVFVATVVWVATVLLALVFVVAAIGLSRFE